MLHGRLTDNDTVRIIIARARILSRDKETYFYELQIVAYRLVNNFIRPISSGLLTNRIVLISRKVAASFRVRFYQDRIFSSPLQGNAKFPEHLPQERQRQSYNVRITSFYSFHQ